MSVSFWKSLPRVCSRLSVLYGFCFFSLILVPGRASGRTDRSGSEKKSPEKKNELLREHSDAFSPEPEHPVPPPPASLSGKTREEPESLKKEAPLPLPESPEQEKGSGVPEAGAASSKSGQTPSDSDDSGDSGKKGPRKSEENTPSGEALPETSSPNKKDSSGFSSLPATEEPGSAGSEKFSCRTRSEAEGGGFKIKPPLPPVRREFRGVWIATVFRINWPPADTDVHTQKRKLRALFDRAAALNYNVVVLQVHPAGDAFYPSARSPWSRWLTGRQGRPPEPLWDPLAFAVEEAHKRGLALHAWFNPFRAGFRSQEPFAPNHIKNRHPDWVKSYGDLYWLDPGLPAVRDYVRSEILNVAEKYAIDGIHLDDYFYPYPAGGRPFPDDESYARYGGKDPDKADWRRENINRFVKSLYEGLREKSPRVVLGISPFGIWRPGHPKDVEGLDAYGRLYADSRKWLREGWVDYLAPQLYWSSLSKKQNFASLLNWWNTQNTRKRILVPGLQINKALDRADRGRELKTQIELIRADGRSAGSIHYNIKNLMKPSQKLLTSRLIGTINNSQTLLPEFCWRENSPGLPAPDLKVSRERKSFRLSWKPGRTSSDFPEKKGGEKAEDGIKAWIVYYLRDGRWDYTILPGASRSFRIPGVLKTRLPEKAALRAVDSFYRPGKPAVLSLKSPELSSESLEARAPATPLAAGLKNNRE